MSDRGGSQQVGWMRSWKQGMEQEGDLLIGWGCPVARLFLDHPWPNSSQHPDVPPLLSLSPRSAITGLLVSAGVCPCGPLFLSMFSHLCLCLLRSQVYMGTGWGAWWARVVLEKAIFGHENRTACSHLGSWAQVQSWSPCQGPCPSLPSSSLPSSHIIIIIMASFL